MLYEFWTFLFVKLVLSFFVIIIIFSTCGGCATKVYHKYKYKQLRWSENEVDDELGDGSRAVDNISRSTSVTLMSFDYSYWKRIRILRLKYFLLKPKPLNRKTAKIQSYPSTPTHIPIKQISKYSLNDNQMNNRLVSLSETNLQRTKTKEDEESTLALEVPQSINKYSDSDNTEQQRSSGSPTTLDRKSYIICEHGNKLRGKSQEKRNQTTSNSLTEKGRRALISICVPDEDAEVHSKLNEKLRKEKENLKRRQSSEIEKSKIFVKKLQKGSKHEKEKQNEGDEMAMKVILQRDKGNSQISVATIHSGTKLSSSCDSQDRMDRDPDQDFEMDYYDYDVMNAGKIPGSYFGLEPAFVLWNSEMYPHDTDDPDDSSYGINNMDQEDDNDNSTMSMVETGSNSKCNIDFDTHQSVLHVKETSLQTLKFVDDEDDEDEDENTQASDSLLDNET